MNKKLYERAPLIVAEKSPFKIFRINLETLCIYIKNMTVSAFFKGEINSKIHTHKGLCYLPYGNIGIIVNKSSGRVFFPGKYC